MIAVTSGTTMVQGTKIDLQVEFTCLVHHLLQEREDGKPIMTREELDYCISLASLPKDELDKQASEALEDILNMFMSGDKK